MSDLLARVVVPARLALIQRSYECVAYNPTQNVWHRVGEAHAEVLRWLRSNRSRVELKEHLIGRFGYGTEEAGAQLQDIVSWCVLRRLLYLDKEPLIPDMAHPANPLATVYWICTQACNLRCTYCYQEAMFARPNELTTQEGRDLIDQALEAGARTFIFTGGEPFARSDLLQLAGYSKSVGLRTNIITNGFYIKKKNIDEIARVFDLVSVSLDHGIPEHHDRHRGAGSWLRSLAAIDLLLDAGVQVDVNSVLSRLGLKDITELLRLRRSRRVRQHRIVPQYPMGRGALHGNDELTPDELLGLNDDIHRANKKLDDELPNAGASAAAAKSNSKGVRRNHCGAGLSEVSVDPEGWVYPCKLLQYRKFRTENVRTARLADIYRNNQLLKSVSGSTTETLAPCSTCIVKNHCGGGCRGIHYSFTHEYSRAHPLFCAHIRRSFEVQAWASTGEVPAPRKGRFRDATGSTSAAGPSRREG